MKTRLESSCNNFKPLYVSYIKALQNSFMRYHINTSLCSFRHSCCMSYTLLKRTVPTLH